MKKSRLIRFLGNSEAQANFFGFHSAKRSASTIVMPISLPEKSLIAEHKSLLQEFRARRNAYDALLRQELNEGVSKINRKEYTQSLIHFEKVIALASGESISNLTAEEKRILSHAYAYSAQILSRLGSDERKKALAHLDLALELDPNLTIALDCKNSLSSEKLINYDSDRYDQELRLLDRKT